MEAFTVYKQRLATFVYWPHVRPSASDMAAAGFYRKNNAPYPDRADCQECKLSLEGWLPTDGPLLLHSALSPECLFIRKQRERKVLGELPIPKLTHTQPAKLVYLEPPTQSKKMYDLSKQFSGWTLSKTVERVAAKTDPRRMQLEPRRPDMCTGKIVKPSDNKHDWCGNAEKELVIGSKREKEAQFTTEVSLDLEDDGWEKVESDADEEWTNVERDDLA